MKGTVRPLSPVKIREEVEKVADAAFRKAGMVTREAAFEEKKFETAIELAYYLLPVAVRVAIKRDTLEDIMGEIRNLLFQQADNFENEIPPDAGNRTATHEADIAPADELTAETHSEARPVFLSGEVTEQVGHICDTAVKPADKDVESKRVDGRDYLRFLIIGTAVILLTAGFFVKSNLPHLNSQSNNEVIQERPPVRTQKNIERQMPASKQAEEMRPAASGLRLSKTGDAKSPAILAQRMINEQKQERREAAKPKLQTAEKKIFAPHSRDVKYFHFGTFLVEKGLVTMESVISARLLQKKNNRMIGDLAKNKGWLTDDDILRISAIQEETYGKFGEIAVKEKYLTKEQVDELCREQSDSYMYFGEALVKTGVISREKVIEQLKEYNVLASQ